ncbi:MAG: septum formation initiator family protein [bacterium]
METRFKLSDKKIIQWLIIFSSLTVITFSLIGDKGVVQLISLKQQQAELKQEIEELKQERKEWIHKIQSIKENRSYIETIAREQLGMIRDDEVVYQLPLDNE